MLPKTHPVNNTKTKDNMDKYYYSDCVVQYFISVDVDT
jgi:hypothetical protein